MRDRAYKLHARLQSMGYAVSGIKTLFSGEPNAKLHLLATVGVIIAGILQHLSKYEWVAIIVAIAIVWIAEAMNTALEKLCDFACNKAYYSEIKIIKDIAAGAVLIAALCSAGIGFVVFVIK